jgi:ABC-type sugar transport system ATPase subunit
MLRATQITKSFFGNVVLTDVDFDLKPGEVHALIGENGAGKSTLVNILSGNHRADSGTIEVDGAQHSFAHPLEAMRAGIAVVHQELSLVPNATVAENMFLRREITNRFGLNDWSAMTVAARKIFKQMGVDIDPNALAGSLSTGMQQLVEVAKALSLKAKYVFMDEPTSSLSEKEIQELFQVVRDLRAQGLGIVFISHKLTELFSISDRITVLRDGRFIGAREIVATDPSEIISMMVGRHMDDLYPAKAQNVGPVMFKCQNLSAFGSVADVSFDVRSGEILGIAGLVGSGRTEAMRALINADPRLSGAFKLNGETIEIKDPTDAMQKGIVYVSEDRKSSGLFLDFSIGQNICVSTLKKKSNKLGLTNAKAIADSAASFIDKMDIRPRNPDARVLDLSGGNQQKVLLSKFFEVEPKLMIVDEPTRGVDVGAKSLIHQRLRDLADTGAAVIVVSSEMPEVLGMADRVLVFRAGRVSAVLNNQNNALSQEEVMAAAIE